MNQAGETASRAQSAMILDFNRPQAAEAASAPARPRKPDSRLDRTCNYLIMAIIAFPFLLGVGALLRRLLAI